ncbi:MAG: hypothetical protein ACP5R4_09760 [Armatimonadota bacterium]
MRTGILKKAKMRAVKPNGQKTCSLRSDKEGVDVRFQEGISKSGLRYCPNV